MSGTHFDIPACGRAVLHALELAKEDITRWTAGLDDSEIHAHPFGLPSVAFHLRHIARSIDRLLSYAEGKQLSGEQLAALKGEQQGSESSAALMAEFQAALQNAEGRIRILATADLETSRGIGRKELPASLGGALIHVADHTQRHAGQVITTSKLLLAMRA